MQHQQLLTDQSDRVIEQNMKTISEPFCLINLTVLLSMEFTRTPKKPWKMICLKIKQTLTHGERVCVCVNRIWT